MRAAALLLASGDTVVGIDNCNDNINHQPVELMAFINTIGVHEPGRRDV